MSTTLPQVIRELRKTSTAVQWPALRRFKWAGARIFFIACVGLGLATVVAGPLMAPLFTWWMFGDWRFWRHLPRALRLYGHGYRILGLMLRGDGSFMLGVPWSSPPLSAPPPGAVELRADWADGASCGSCNRCCRHGRQIACPILDLPSGRCLGYDSFFWRYFNCGRFPSQQREIEYYDCPKWLMRPTLRSRVSKDTGNN